MATKTFIVDCPNCKTKVAAEQVGMASNSGCDDDSDYPYANRLYVGNCPRCQNLLAGESHQIAFEGIDAYYDVWSEVVRVYPKPSKTFSSYRIPQAVTDSLQEADKSLHAGAFMASCVMLGRTLEAICRDILEPETPLQSSSENSETTPSKKKMMLREGIEKLKDGKHIDERLYDWSKQLHAFRNIAAHPDEVVISWQDAEDLQAFTYAIIEYIYDLADRYEDLKERLADEAKKKMKKKKRRSRLQGLKAKNAKD